MEIVVLLYLVGAEIIPVMAGAIACIVYEIWWTVCLIMLFRKARIFPVLAIIPVYRLWRLFRAVDGLGFRVLFCCIPVLGILEVFKFCRRAAMRYSMSKLFGTCMFFLPVIFWTWLAFGSVCNYISVDNKAGRIRDARGYEGGGIIDGLYDEEDLRKERQAKQKADLEELRRRRDAKTRK